MITYSQLVKYSRTKKSFRSKTPALRGNPQKRGMCRLIYLIPPKKPHSAQRRVSRVHLRRSHIEVICYVPGERAELQRYANVLIRGGRTRDLPGVKYKVIRGMYDLAPVYTRMNARSKYGTRRFRKDSDEILEKQRFKKRVVK